MRSRIADDLNRTDLNSQIDEAINRAIDYYEVRRTWFNETTGTVSTVASQQAYGTSDGVPSDILEIDKITFAQSSSAVYTLYPRTIQQILDINVTATTYTGVSNDYAWYQGKLYLYPTPDGAYTVTFYYQKSYSDLTADGDSNDWSDNAEDLIESRAQWWIYSRLLNNPSMASIHKQNEIEAWDKISRRTESMLSTGKLRPTSF